MGGILVHLKSWKVLGNNGLDLVYANAHGLKARHYVPSNGLITLPEAAQILSTTEVQLHRLKRARKLRTRTRSGVTCLAVSEVLRLKRDPEALYPGRTT